MQAKDKKTQWSRTDKALMMAIGVTVLLVALGISVFRNLNADPIAVIPTPTLPSPNAFDYFIAAGNAVIDSNKIGNAASYTPNTLPHTDPDDRAYSLAEKQALVAENAGALKTLHAGFAYPYLNPPIRSISAVFSYHGKFGGLARLLVLEGKVDAANGDWNGTVNSGLDAIHLGEMTARSNDLLGCLVGIYCQGNGQRLLWSSIDNIGSAKSRDAVRQLERFQAQHVPLAAVMQEEKWSNQASLMEIFHEGSWRTSLSEELGDDAASETKLNLSLFFLGKKHIFDNYTSYMDYGISNLHRPYAAKLPYPPVPTDPISQIMRPDFLKAYLRDVDSQTQNALLTAALALRAYRLEHDAYPDTLVQLVPAYLTRVPDDPFVLSGPLHYKRQGQKYTLYSVGPDGVDNDGKPIFDPSQKPPSVPGATDKRYLVKAESKGDVVAGLNF